MIASHTGISDVRLASWAEDTSVSPLQRMLALAADPSILSLALGLPDPCMFPAEGLAQAAREVLEQDREALQYKDPYHSRLKQFVCEVMARRNVSCTPDEIFLTSGAQQALALIARLLLDDGGTVTEEEMSYTGFQQAIEPFRPRVLRVRSSAAEGIDIDMLEQVLDNHPEARFLYVMADGHNPLGVSLARERRRALAELAHSRQIPVIEDDVYGLLQYEPDPAPPIRAFGDEWVWYVGSFSKVLAPALRLGWVVAPRSLSSKLSIVKEASDINTCTFSQRIACRFLEVHSLADHIAGLQRLYRAKRDAMEAALRSNLPAYCEWRKPSAGVFFWVDLPEDIDASAVLRIALERHGVAFLPAAAFSRGTRHNGMRLCFSRCSLSDLPSGAQRVAAALNEYCASERKASSV